MENMIHSNSTVVSLPSEGRPKAFMTCLDDSLVKYTSQPLYLSRSISRKVLLVGALLYHNTNAQQ
jgi:hypothetical protein